jgi:signal peptidase II
MTVLGRTHRVWTRQALIYLMIGVSFNVILDQVSKYLAQENLMVFSHSEDLKIYEGKRVFLSHLGELASIENPLPQFSVEFALTYVRNQGAAWGFLSDVRDEIRVPFFYLVSIIALIMILRYLATTPKGQGLVRFGLMLVLSGAIGNLIDRIRFGYVIDFLDVKWDLPIPFTEYIWRYDYPKFNWADSCICIGVCLLMIDVVFFESKRQKSQKGLL